LPCGFCLSSFFFFPCLISAVGDWTQKIAIWHHRTTLSGCIFAAKACIDNPEKNIDTSSTRPHNMVNFGLPMAEICWRLWGTPANFNGFRVLAALLHGNLVVGVSQILRH